MADHLLKSVPVANPAAIQKAMQELLEKGVVGRHDTPKVAVLSRLASQQSRLRLNEVLKAIWPDKSDHEALNLYRGFKMRLNQQLTESKINIALVSNQDNRSAATKFVWFEEQQSAEEMAVRQAVEAIERASKRTFLDTLPGEYVPQEVTTGLPLVTFPDELASFAQYAASEAWTRTDDYRQKFLANIGTRLAPVVQVLPRTISPLVVGFECLPLGPQGQDLQEIRQRAADFNPGLLSLLIALSAMRTAFTLRTEAADAGNLGVSVPVFIIRLDQDLLTCPAFDILLERYHYLWEKNVVFEVDESLATINVERLRALHHEFRLRFCATNFHTWKNTAARAAVAEALELTKIDHECFMTCMEVRNHNPNLAIRRLASSGASSRSLIVTCVIDEEQLRFLEPYWDKQKRFRLCTQHSALLPGSLWEPWLIHLSDYGLDGDFILSSQLLAQATKVVATFLAKDCRLLRAENLATIYRLTLPKGSVYADKPFVLAVLTERVRPSAELRRLLLDVDYLVVRESTTALDFIEQVTAEQLPQYLRTFSQAPQLAERTVHDTREAHYRPEAWIAPEVEASQEKRDNRHRSLPWTDHKTIGSAQRAESTARESFEEGRAFLLRWLTERDVPFCALLGDYGVGKSFLCRMLTLKLLDLRKNDVNLRVPLYLDMRDLPTWKDGRVPRLPEMLKELVVAAGFSDISIDGLLAAVRRGHILLIFDGFDEKAAHLTDAQASELLREIRNAVPPHARSAAKVLIACRTHYFVDQPDERSKIQGGALQRTREGFVQSDFRFVYLRKFDTARIKQYLNTMLGEKAAADTFTFLSSIHNLLDLAERPYLLSLIVNHIPAIKARIESGLPLRLTDLYEIVVEEWLRRDIGKHLIFQEIKIAFMEDLARNMWQKTSAALHFKDLRTWLLARLRKRNIVASNLDELMRADADLRTATFLTRDTVGNYQFAHTSFLEFFLARQIARLLLKDKPRALDLPRLNHEILTFCVDLLNSPRGESTEATRSLASVLERAYSPRVSENALLLTVSWNRRYASSAPRPCRYRLEQADLSRLDLSGQEFREMFCRSANLQECDLSGARIRGDLSEANLMGVRAADLDATGSSLRDAQVTAANFAGAVLRECDLTRVSGSGVFLQRADLSRANIKEARLVGVRLAGAVVSDEQFADAGFEDVSAPTTTASSVRLVAEGSHSGPVNAIVIGHHGRLVASGGEDGTVKLWEIATGRLVRTLVGHAASVRNVAFHTDGQLVASASVDRSVKVWDVNTGHLVRTLLGHTDSVISLAFQPEGQLVASASVDRSIKLWDVDTGELLRSLGGHATAITSVAFQPGGRILASASEDGTVKLWEMSTGRLLQSRKLEVEGGCKLTLDARGANVASMGKDGRVSLWHLRNWQAVFLVPEPSLGLGSVAFDPLGRTLMIGRNDGGIRLWETSTGRLQRTPERQGTGLSSLTLDELARTLAIGTTEGVIKVWDNVSGGFQKTPAGHGAGINKVGFDPRGAMLASASEDCSVQLWDSTTGCLWRRTLRAHDSRVRNLTFHPEGRLLATAGDDRKVMLWDVETGQLLRTLEGHGTGICGLAFDREGQKVAFVGHDLTTLVWDVATGQQLQAREGQSGRRRERQNDLLSSVTIDSKARVVASAGADQLTIRLWELSTGRRLHTLLGHREWVNSLSFDSEARILASASADGIVKLWDVASGVLVRTLEEACTGVSSVVLDPEGRLLATASDDRKVMLWDVDTGQLLRTLEGHGAAICSLAFDWRRRTLATASADGVIKVWDVDTGQLHMTLADWSSSQWVAFTSDGIFECSDSTMPFIGYSHGTVVYPAEEWEAVFRKPQELTRRFRWTESLGSDAREFVRADVAAQ